MVNIGKYNTWMVCERIHIALEKRTKRHLAFLAGPFSSETFVDHGFSLRVGDWGGQGVRDCEYGAFGVCKCGEITPINDRK